MCTAVRRSNGTLQVAQRAFSTSLHAHSLSIYLFLRFDTTTMTEAAGTAAAAENQFRLHTASSIETTETGLNR